MTKEEIRKALRTVLRSSPVRSHVRRISLFGSYLHGNVKQNSDIDLLLEYSEPISLLDIVHMQHDLETLLKKKVDLLTPGFLSTYFRSDVLKEAEPLYEAR